jgi:hypothetical protein
VQGLGHRAGEEVALDGGEDQSAEERGAGALAFLALRRLPARLGLGLTGAALLGALVLAPVEGDLLARTTAAAKIASAAAASTRRPVAASTRARGPTSSIMVRSGRLNLRPGDP